MPKITYDMVIDFARPYKTHTLLCSQDDHLSRVPHFILRANGKSLDVSDVETYTITAVKPDSTTSHESGVLDKDDEGNYINEITYAVPQDLTNVIGTCTCTVTLNGSDGSVLQSFEFYIKNRNELKDEDDDTEDDLAGFRDILDRATAAIEKIEQLSTKSKLPNPEALRLVLGDDTYSYDGDEAVLVTFTGIAYVGGDKIGVNTINWYNEDDE